jgi:nickel transport protein
MARYLCAAVGIWLALIAPARAHEIRHSVGTQAAVVVHLFEDDQTPFADAHVEIFGPGDTIAFCVERTDAAGRVAFVPDREGEWRLRAFSEDGHGVDITVDTRELTGTVEVGAAHVSGDRRSYAVLGVGIILGLFGVAALLRRRVPA